MKLNCLAISLSLVLGAYAANLEARQRKSDFGSLIIEISTHDPPIATPPPSLVNEPLLLLARQLARQPPQTPQKPEESLATDWVGHATCLDVQRTTRASFTTGDASLAPSAV